MTIEELKARGLIVYECISGSKAYGLDVPGSDTDIKGVFVLPQSDYYGFEYVPQMADETNDTVYYELGRFLELLKKNNPNILEMLGTPPAKVLLRHPLLESLHPSLFLSKRCKDTFGGFAFTQIKKARGLNKKIVNPVDEKRKTILAFCYVLQGQGSLPLEQWLVENKLKQERCGLVNIPHVKDVYGLFVDEDGDLGYQGILKKENATSVRLSSIPKGEMPRAYLYFNKDGYATYCKDYRDYWAWVEKRNDARYENNIEHGKNYDSKNMMHTFRLLDMAVEILAKGEVIVERPNREELLSIRAGEWEYDALIAQANEKMAEVEIVYAKSNLPASPDEAAIDALLVNLRTAFYQQSPWKLEV
jgi:hypothetical protein